MKSHLLLMVLFAFFVSLVFAVISKDEVREQIRFGGMMFGGFMLAAIVLGWYGPGEGAGLIGAVVGAIIVLFVYGYFAGRKAT